jgi:hypothetical protein
MAIARVSPSRVTLLHSSFLSGKCLPNLLYVPVYTGRTYRATLTQPTNEDIKALLKASGITKQEAADLLHVKVSTIMGIVTQ